MPALSHWGYGYGYGSPRTGNWWAWRWTESLERLDDRGRLRRGRSYANIGHVIRLEAGAAGVVARVRGSRYTPYEVVLRLRHIADAAWERALDALGAEARYGAMLLAGSMPEEIEGIFARAGAPLFPAGLNELAGSCSCPDWVRPCKHVAAVSYLLGDRLGNDPLLLLELRGRTREQIVTALRERRLAAMGPESGDRPVEENADGAEGGERPAVERAHDFWRPGASLDDLAFGFTPPAASAIAIKRLGPAPWSYERKELTTLLERAYEAISAQALRRWAGQQAAQRLGVTSTAGTESRTEG